MVELVGVPWTMSWSQQRAHLVYSLNYCFYQENHYTTNVATYQNKACCDGSELSKCGAVHIAVSSSVLLLLGVLSFILFLLPRIACLCCADRCSVCTDLNW